MTAGQKRVILRQAQSLGYSGSNLGQVYAVAESIVRGTTRYSWTAAQRRTANSIWNKVSNSG